MNYLCRVFSPENLPNMGLCIMGAIGIIIAFRTLNATAISAKAARLNAEALINSERAWIMVELLRVPGVGGLVEGKSIMKEILTYTTTCNARLICKNNGRTPAWITEKRACIDVVDSLPATPDWNAVDVIQDEPEPLAVGDASSTDKALTCNKPRDPEKMTVVYGIARYRDVFKPDRTTTFGYKIRVDGKLERLTGYPEYNKNT